LGWVAEKYPKLIAQIVDLGHEVACHSNCHQLAYNQTPSEFRADLRRAKSQIAYVTGVEPTSYRIPGFSLTTETLWVFEILLEEGFTVDCSVFPAVRGHGGLPEFETHEPCLVRTPSGCVREFPLNTRAFLGNPVVFSGGGYFRLFPYYVLKKLFNESDYVMTYFHPRDFDPDQPVLGGLSWQRRFKSYVGLKGSEEKLKRILNDFEFTDLRAAVEEVNWDKVPVVDV
jgi:polysaccharide deacetylase family protein (PEP-CTERM system associated)